MRIPLPPPNNMILTDEQLLRFWSKVDKSTDCWNWTGARNNKGYGFFFYNQKRILAHRGMWELYGGSIPHKMCVCHKCDNPRCVRFEHLFLATNAENVADKMRKNRHKNGVHAGTRNPFAKLTIDEVRLIRSMASEGRKHPEIASLFGVARTTVTDIVNRRAWRSVTP